MKNEQSASPAIWLVEHPIPLFLIASLAAWLYRSFITAFLFRNGTFISQIFRPDALETESRLFIVFILLVFVLLLKLAVSSGIRSEDKYRELVQYSNSIILRLDEAGNVTFINRYAQDFFGFTEKELIGRNVVGTIVPKKETTGRDLELMIKDIISSPDSYKVNINENVKRSGERLWIIWTNKSIRTGKDRCEILCIGNDMTKIKEAEEKLKEAMDIKSKFIAMASHELRSPLTVIGCGIDMIANGSAGPLTKKQKEYLEGVKSYIARLYRVAEDILTIQKFEAGKMTFEMEENDLNATVVNVVTMMKSATSEKGLDLITNLSDTAPKFFFDKDRVAQVLINLITNAVKFTDKGRISVSTFLEADFVRVSVSDTGCGMRPEETHMIFEKFAQLNNARERKAGGTGLGLSIAKEIVLHHAGNIWVESELGRGTTFNFKLPLKRKR